jgi:F-type H+-transporting ATPase subunit b
VTITMTMTRNTEQGRTACLAAALVAGALLIAAPASAQPAEPARTPAPAGHAAQQSAGTPAADAQDVPKDAHDAAAPTAGHGAADDTHGATPAGAHGAEGAHGDAHGESLWVTLARVANFAILAGVIYWLARKPLATHLASRGAQIRKDLVDAAETRKTATARLAEIEAKLAALPGELEQMRARSAAELEAERVRIRTAAESERDRLVEQARREIASQTRAARMQLRQEAATLAVDVAAQRLRGTLTPAEQSALVDRYANQMRNLQ